MMAEIHNTNSLVTGKVREERQTAIKEQRAIETQDSEKFSTQKVDKLIEERPSWKLIVFLLVLAGAAAYWLRSWLKS